MLLIVFSVKCVPGDAKQLWAYNYDTREVQSNLGIYGQYCLDRSHGFLRLVECDTRDTQEWEFNGVAIQSSGKSNE